MTSQKTKDKLKHLSASPGVYKMLDRGQKIIYVGKAKNLKKRVLHLPYPMSIPSATAGISIFAAKFAGGGDG